MQDLRLVGVQEDGGHLLLSGPGGTVFRLRIDEALRVAASRPQPRPHSGPDADAEGQQTSVDRLSPRDIQSRIRSGSAAEDIAEASGLPVEHIRKYEGPVLAERAHIAQQAQNVLVSDALPSHDGYRSAFGDDPATLREMVSYRLNALGVDLDSLAWDAWRRPDGLWTVIAEFNTQAPAAHHIGEASPAQWTFNPARQNLQNMNRWAQLLSEIEPLDEPVPARRLSAVADQPFDIEAKSTRDHFAQQPGSAQGYGVDSASEQYHDEDEGSLPVTEQSSSADEGVESVSLLELLRSRRGQRLGRDEEEDDALALFLSENSTESEPASDSDFAETDPAGEPQANYDAGEVSSADDAQEGGKGAEPGSRTEQQSFFPALSLAPDPASETDPAVESAVQDTLEIPRPGSPRIPAGNSSRASDTATREITISGAPRPRPEAPASEDASSPAAENGPPAPEPERRKPKRSSVPSWDEIVFGTKTD